MFLGGSFMSFLESFLKYDDELLFFIFVFFFILIKDSSSREINLSDDDIQCNILFFAVVIFVLFMNLVNENNILKG